MRCAAPASPGPYAIAFFFAIGVLLSTVPANLLLMARPLDGKPPVDGADYWQRPLGWHVAGVLGGAIWCTGAVANFVASGAHLVGPAVSYSIGQGATMVSASGASSSGANSPARRALRKCCFSHVHLLSLGTGRCGARSPLLR